MALDAKDIARIKARIPDNYQPPHETDGTLSNAFFSIDADTRRARALERHNLGAHLLDNPDLAGTNVTLSGAHASIKAQRISHEERKKREADQRDVIDQIIAQIEARNREIAENLARLEELDAQDEALSGYLDRLQRGEALDLDADGHFKNKKAEDAIREYEQRYGVEVDRTDAAQLAIILKGIRDEKLQARREIKTLIQEAEHDRQIAIGMGANPASIPLTVTTLEKTSEGRRTLDDATAKLDDTGTTADAIKARDFDETTEKRALELADKADVDSFFSEQVDVTLSKPTTPKI